MEQLNAFISKFAQNDFPAGDLFPIRKTVGRPRLRYLNTRGVRIPYLSPADLVFFKEDSWRDKDKLDVQALREILARESPR